MGKWSKLFVALGLGVLLFVGQAQAVLLFSEDFEDDTIGMLPAIGGTNIGAGYGLVTNVVSVAANPDASAGSGNESAQVLSGAGGSLFANNIVALFAGGAASLDGLMISYDFYCSTGSHDNDGVRSSIVWDADGIRDVFMRNDRDQLIKVDGTDQTQTNYGASVWQNWTATFTQTGEGSYDLAFEITNLVTGESQSGTQAVTVDNTAVRGILLEAFEGNAANNDFTGYIDNVSVVPEPVTMLLLGLGGVCAMRRRRG